MFCLCFFSLRSSKSSKSSLEFNFPKLPATVSCSVSLLLKEHVLKFSRFAVMFCRPVSPLVQNSGKESRSLPPHNARNSSCCLELPLAQNSESNVLCFVSLLLKSHIYIQIPNLAFDVLSVSLPAQKNNLRSVLQKSSKFSTPSLDSTLFKKRTNLSMFCLSLFWGYIYSKPLFTNSCSVCLSSLNVFEILEINSCPKSCVNHSMFCLSLIRRYIYSKISQSQLCSVCLSARSIERPALSSFKVPGILKNLKVFSGIDCSKQREFQYMFYLSLLW